MKKRIMNTAMMILAFAVTLTIIGSFMSIESFAYEDVTIGFVVDDKLVGADVSLVTDLYNGDPAKLRFTVENAADVYMKHGNHTDYIQHVVMADDKYRLIQFKTVPNTEDFYVKPETLSSGATMYKKFIPLLKGDNNNNGTGFASGIVRVKIEYDFNGDGRYTADEYIGTTTYNVAASTKRADALALCQSVLGEGRGSYNDDMYALIGHIARNYTHRQVPCGQGAYILETWSIYKYGVYGYFGNPPGSAADHVEFYPLNNPYSTVTCWGAEGEKAE